LWKRDEGILFLRTGVAEYRIGGTGTDQACLADEFIQTQLSVDAVALDGIITVNSTAGMQGLVDSGVADNIGIQLADGTRQWTTIAEVLSPTQIDLVDSLTADAAAGNTVFVYENEIGRPLRVEDARRTLFGSNSEIEMEHWARQEYFAQPNKTSTGTPTMFYYQPRLDQGRIYIWQTASSVNQLVKFTFARSFKDFDTAANNPDFPVEWLDALVYNLAERLAIEYQTPTNRLQLIKMKAAELLEAVLGWDEEDTSLNLQPDFEQ
jgi:hypothetical protein